jgi:hypothetical protein
VLSAETLASAASEHGLERAGARDQAVARRRRAQRGEPGRLVGMERPCDHIPPTFLASTGRGLSRRMVLARVEERKPSLARGIH